jgi:outer membrane protein assembly factor BamB
VLCLDEASGKILWKHEYDCPYQVSYASGPRTTPVIAGDKVYTIGAMGHLVCLELNTGKVVWQHDLLAKYKIDVPVWGFAGHPLVDGDHLICLVVGQSSGIRSAHGLRYRWRASVDPLASRVH